MLLWLINCVFFAVYGQVYRTGKLQNLPSVVFKQTYSKCAFGHKHNCLHRFMNKIYIYLTFSLKETIKGERYFEIRKKFVSHWIVSFSWAIKNSGCCSDFEIPLSRAWNTTVWDKYHSYQPIKLQDFIEPCYNWRNGLKMMLLEWSQYVFKHSAPYRPLYLSCLFTKLKQHKNSNHFSCT